MEANNSNNHNMRVCNGSQFTVQQKRRFSLGPEVVMRSSNRSRCNRRQIPWEASGTPPWGLSLAVVAGQQREGPVRKRLGRGSLDLVSNLGEVTWDCTRRCHGKACGSIVFA
jgi:hypothetical protein